jgi:hypothetical protein
MDGLSQFAPRADQAPATPVIRRHIDHSSAWKVADFRSPADYSIDLAPAELADIESCVKAVRALGLKLEDIERKHFPLPTMAGTIEAIRREIADGRGFVVGEFSPGVRMVVSVAGTEYRGRPGTIYSDVSCCCQLSGKLPFNSSTTPPRKRHRPSRSASTKRGARNANCMTLLT